MRKSGRKSSGRRKHRRSMSDYGGALAKTTVRISRQGQTMKSFTVIVDTREKRPLSFTGHPVVRRGLRTGDYSIDGYADKIAIERKSLPDLLGSLTSGRKRMDACVERLLQYESKALLIEAMPFNLENGCWRPKVHPNAVLGSVISWKMRGLPVIYASTQEQASRYVLWFLKLFWERNGK